MKENNKRNLRKGHCYSHEEKEKNFAGSVDFTPTKKKKKKVPLQTSFIFPQPHVTLRKFLLLYITQNLP